jgi:hypothetical protein
MLNQDCLLFLHRTTAFKTPVEALAVRKSDQITLNKGLPQQAEVAQGGPVTLRPRIFVTFGTTRVVGRQPYTPAAFTPGEIPGNHF